MPRLARIAPALIGLALAAPATARAQSHEHGGAPCAYCQANHATSLTPVVQERRGPFGLPMGKKVVIPAGHMAEGRGATVPGPVSNWSDQAAHLPPASAWAGNPADAGVASIGPGSYAPVGMPTEFSNGPVAPGEPMPIGEMRTSYSPTAPGSVPAPAGMSAPMGPSGVSPMAAPMARPDPAIQAWHHMKLSERAAPRRADALSKMLGISTVGNWLEERRTIRAMRHASKRGLYAPMMSEMPGRAVMGR